MGIVDLEDNSEFHKRVTLKWLTIIALVGTLIFILLISLYGSGAHSGEFCGKERYTDSSFSLPSINTTHQLQDNNSYVLQQFDTIEKINVGFEFCYEVIVDSDSGAEVEVIDQDLTVLSSDFLKPGLNDLCTELPNLESTKNYLGVKCSSCNITDFVVLRRDVGGADTKQVIVNSGVTTIQENVTLKYALVGKNSCEESVKFFTKSYFTLLMVLLLLAFIIVGYERMREIFFNQFIRVFNQK